MSNLTLFLSTRPLETTSKTKLLLRKIRKIKRTIIPLKIEIFLTTPTNRLAGRNIIRGYICTIICLITISVLFTKLRFLLNRSESKMNGDRNGISMNGGDLLKRYRYTPEVLESLARKEIEDRVKLLLYHLRRLGIPENFLFSQDDLIELKNVPKVTRCIATLAKMVS